MPDDSTRIRILGTAQIEVGQSRVAAVEALLAQPKRLALLGYLAASPRERWVSRQDLLFNFWPELDESRARKACSQALWVLRQALGEDAVEKRGYSDVRLAPEGVWVDVWRVQRAVAEGDDEEVVEVYRGELLAGLTLREAPAFERWLDEQRSFTGRTARDAAWRLADAAVSANDPARALHFDRWAFRVAGRYDERALRRLLRSLAETGDRAAARELYRAYERELRQDGAEPHPETVELAVRLTRLPESTAQHAGGGPGPSFAPPSAVVAEPAAKREARVDRASGRPNRLTAALLATLALVATVGFLGRRPVMPPEVDGNQRVAVLPFEVRGPDALAYLGPAMSDLVTARLDGVARLRGIDPNTVRAVASDPAADPRRVARALGGDHLVAGSVVAAGSTLELQARMYDADGRVVASANARGENDEKLSPLLDTLSLRLVRDWLSDSGATLDYGAAEETPSLGALKAYLEGEEAFRRFDLQAAVTSFQKAVREDSTFALAHFRLSRVGDWLNAREFDGSMDRAAAYSDRLPRRHGRLVEAYLEFWRGSVPGGTLALESLVADYPGDAEAWFQLGEARFHGGPRIGASILEAEGAFRQAHELAPRDPRPLLHLLALVAMRGDDAEVRRLASLLPASDPLRRFQIFAFSNPDAPVEAVEVELAKLPVALLPGATLSAADALGRPDLMDAAGRLILEADPTPGLARQAWMLRALAAEAAGDSAAATAAARSLGEYDPGQGAALELYLRVLPSRGPDAGDRPGVATCATLDAVAAVGILAARQGAWATVDSALQALRAGEVPNQQAELALLIEAEAALSRGKPEVALDLIETRRRARTALTSFATSPTFPHAYERVLRARILEEVGRSDEALRWYASIPALVSYSLPFQRPALEARARILEGVGRSDEAAALRKRAAALAANW